MFITEMELKIYFIIMRKFYIFQLTNILIIQVLDQKKKKVSLTIFLNIPLEAGTTAEEYLNAYENVLNKLERV